MQLSLIEKQGWQKRVLIDSAVTRIGSDATNDIHLSSENIAPVHLQIFYLKDQPSSCKVVNVSENAVEVHGRISSMLAPLGQINLKDGDEVHLGEYKIVFHLPLVGYVGKESKSIKASLLLPDTVLPANAVMEGRLIVGNAGQVDDCQFQVELNGLPEDCYRIDPIPLMYSGAQEIVTIRLYHRKMQPKAGSLEFELRITSPDSYPGEELVLRQGFYIAPVFEHVLAFESDHADDDIPGGEVGSDFQGMNLIRLDENVSVPLLDMGGNQTLNTQSGNTSDALDTLAEKNPQTEDKGLEDADPETDDSSVPSKLRVISNQFDDFWEDPD